MAFLLFKLILLFIGVCMFSIVCMYLYGWLEYQFKKIAIKKSTREYNKDLEIEILMLKEQIKKRESEVGALSNSLNYRQDLNDLKMELKILQELHNN